jgi:hypothetical protein
MVIHKALRLDRRTTDKHAPLLPIFQHLGDQDEFGQGLSLFGGQELLLPIQLKPESVLDQFRAGGGRRSIEHLFGQGGFIDGSIHL